MTQDTPSWQERFGRQFDVLFEKTIDGQEFYASERVLDFIQSVADTASAEEREKIMKSIGHDYTHIKIAKYKTSVTPKPKNSEFIYYDSSKSSLKEG